MSLTVGLTVDWPDEFGVPSFPVPPQVPKAGKRWGTWGKGWFFGAAWQSVAKGWQLKTGKIQNLGKTARAPGLKV